MARVDLAGEAGAVRIYRAQLAGLALRRALLPEWAQSRDEERRRDTMSVAKALAEEQRHRRVLASVVAAHRVRPSALDPVWAVGATAPGLASALAGGRAVHATTVGVENVIGDHYNWQLRELVQAGKAPAGSLAASMRRVAREFRDDELAHRDEALELGAEEAVGFAPLSAAVTAVTKVAITLSTKI